MRNASSIAIMVMLLALLFDVRQPEAQPAQGGPMFGTFEPSRPQPEARKPKTAAHRHVKPHKHHVVHAPANQRKIAERNGYKRVSDLVNFPKFFPGLGIIYVKPDTLPLGPFLCFDRDDRLMATVYMVALKDMDDHKPFEAPALDRPVDHVSIYFNGGHPGVDMPHYHIVMWHVTKDEESRVAQ